VLYSELAVGVKVPMMRFRPSQSFVVEAANCVAM